MTVCCAQCANVRALTANATRGDVLMRGHGFVQCVLHSVWDYFSAHMPRECREYRERARARADVNGGPVHADLFD